MIDENKNGLLSNDEISNYLSQLLTAIESTSYGNKKETIKERVSNFTNKLFESLNKNKDAEISAEEFISFRQKNEEEFDQFFDFSNVLNQLL